MMDHKTILRDFIAQFLQQGEAEEFGDDTELFSTGILNSMRLVQLVSLIESEAGIQVEPIELNEDNFGSIDAIAAFVAKKQHPSQ